jgi:hypothetical protein
MLSRNGLHKCGLSSTLHLSQLGSAQPQFCTILIFVDFKKHPKAPSIYSTVLYWDLFHCWTRTWRFVNEESIEIIYSATVLHRSIESAPKDPSTEIQVGIQVSRWAVPRLFHYEVHADRDVPFIEQNKLRRPRIQLTTQLDKQKSYLVQSVGLSTKKNLVSMTRIHRKCHQGHSPFVEENDLGIIRMSPHRLFKPKT